MNLVGDPSRKSRSCPRRGENEKPDLYAVASRTKVWLYSALARYRRVAKVISDPLERFRFASRLHPDAAISQSRIRLLFFFEVFFATFLVAAFAVFFAFFAFLAISSSSKKMAQ
jgi:hypothetical protein